MNNKSSNNFFQPVISTFGLAISILTTLLPLFSKEIITSLFLNSRLAVLSSFVSFMIGIAIIWQIMEFQPFIQINLGEYKQRKNGIFSYWKTITANNVIWILIIINIIIGFLFFYFGMSYMGEAGNLLQTLQALLYIVFFLSLISIFAILFAQTKQRFTWLMDKENFPLTIFETLEKNRLIKPYIEIYENRPMNLNELQQEGIVGIFSAKKIRVRTSIQEEEIIEFIASNDGKEVIRVLKKGK